uniref:Uncharacterized protein n=1 Tax=Triticum urartu TaxID=4572 RepID=A0A8R7PZH3_TRIUA
MLYASVLANHNDSRALHLSWCFDLFSFCNDMKLSFYLYPLMLNCIVMKLTLYLYPLVLNYIVTSLESRTIKFLCWLLQLTDD